MNKNKLSDEQNRAFQSFATTTRCWDNRTTYIRGASDFLYPVCHFRRSYAQCFKMDSSLDAQQEGLPDAYIEFLLEVRLMSLCLSQLQ